MAATVVARTGSGRGRGQQYGRMAPDDLESWSEAVEALAGGRDAVWMNGGRNPEIRFEQSGRAGSAVFVVADAAASGSSVRVLARLPDEWSDEHREGLRRVRTARTARHRARARSPIGPTRPRRPCPVHGAASRRPGHRKRP
ncbi:DUF5959 family protein [Streptomyces fructofermentans]|uniref:DUF5959 family protein n=1 Tax=Streptomyces fructofermentans TaxID=152141 RepID=UPI003400745C